MAIMNDDVNQLERFLDQGATDLYKLLRQCCGRGDHVLGCSWVALWAIVPIPVIVAGSFIYQRRIGVRYSKVRSLITDLNALLNNNLQGITTIKSFTAEEGS